MKNIYHKQRKYVLTKQTLTYERNLAFTKCNIPALFWRLWRGKLDYGGRAALFNVRETQAKCGVYLFWATHFCVHKETRVSFSSSAQFVFPTQNRR